MIKIERANKTNTEVIALLGRLTYVESHGHFVEDKNDLSQYIDKAFSVSTTRQDLEDPKNLFYLIYADDLPVGYAKIVLNTNHDNVDSQNSCKLERIYILNDFIPLKIGQQLLTYIEEQANALQFETMWLSVYIKNKRAIRFYERNEFRNVGTLNFMVNETEYETTVLSKKL